MKNHQQDDRCLKGYRNLRPDVNSVKTLGNHEQRVADEGDEKEIAECALGRFWRSLNSRKNPPVDALGVAKWVWSCSDSSMRPVPSHISQVLRTEIFL